MPDAYTDEKLLKDYHFLSSDNQRKVEKYIKAACKLQRMENRISGEIYRVKWQRKREDPDADICCSFCGRAREDADRIIAGSGVFICDECVELCVEVLDEVHREEQ